MTKKDKLLERFLSIPKDFTYYELKALLNSFGYEERNLGKTSGSRVSFYNRNNGHQLKLHKPHPENIFKRVYLKNIKIELIFKKII
jgi:hypothetical protein